MTTKRRTDEQFKNELINLVGNEYTSLSKYLRAHNKVKMKHNTCGHVWDVTANSFLRGRRCPPCSQRKASVNRRKTHEQFLAEFDQVTNGDYELLTNYVKNNKKIKVLHKECKHEYFVTPKNFVNNGRRCPNCFKKERRSNGDFLKKIEKMVGYEYVALEKYIDNRTPILFRHVVCGYEWKIRPHNFTHLNRRCPKCRINKPRKTHEQFEQEVFDLVGDEFLVLGEYSYGNEEVEMLHVVCNTRLFVTPSTFLQRGSCSECNMSKGESRIAYWLRKNKVDYIVEKTFENFKSQRGRPYRFDFAVYIEDRLLMLIEYDGEQHFKPVDWGSKGVGWANENYLSVVDSDKIKNKYCKENGIELLRIPYWDFNNIEETLERKIPSRFETGGNSYE